MRFSKYAFGLALMLLIWPVAFARAQRMSYSDTKRTIERIKDQSDKFNDNFNDDVHRSGVDSQTRHDMKRAVNRFEEAAEDLRRRYHKEDAAIPSVQRVLADAAYIDSFLSKHVVSPRVQDEWLLLRQDLDLLANSYNLDTTWPSALARTEYPVPAVVVVPVQPGSTQVQDLIGDIQAHAAVFESNLRGAESGPAVDQYFGDFMVSAEKLKTVHTSGYPSADAAREVLARGELIDQYMREHPVSVSAQESWIRLKSDLARLAAAYSPAPAWLNR
jgi:hypothetical protein